MRLLRISLPVYLIEVDSSAAAGAAGRIEKLLEADVAAGRLNAAEVAAMLSRLSCGDDWSGLAHTDLAIEAVVERIEVKRAVFAKLGQLARPDAILASNTSSLSVAELAGQAGFPQRILGLHFFNPVPKMPIVEIVRTAQTDDASLATVVSLALQLGKTPIVARNSPGFIVNRLLTPYFFEAFAIAAESVPIPAIDEAMKQWGMPLGPFELMDLIGIDVVIDIMEYVSRFSDHLSPMPDAIIAAREHGWLGRKSACGFYRYEEAAHAKTRPVFKPLADMLAGNPSARAAQSNAELQSRLVMIMVNEAAKLLEEGVVDSADSIDLAVVLGLGLAPFRGGLIRYADTLGLVEIVHRLDELAARHGSRFSAARALRELAERRGRMESWQSR